VAPLPPVLTAGGDCTLQSRHPDARKWCESLLAPPEVQFAKQADLESRFAGCEWTTQDAVSGILMHSYAPNISMDVIDYNPFEPWPKPGQPHARVSSCRSGPWTFARFGPALTTGGNDWTSGAFPFDVHGGDWATGPRLVEFLKKDEVDMYGPMPFGLKAAPASYSPTEHASVSGYYLGSTTAAGKMIPYPPLHKHHFHFLESTSQDTQEAILTMHGDAECEEAKGGPACGIRLFPDGYAMRVGRAFGMHAQVNDVRASGSPNLEHYFVAALRLDERPIRAIQHAVYTPMLISGYGVGSLSTVLVPGRGQFAAWNAGTFYHHASVLFGYVHHHGQWAEASRWYVNSTIDELGLDGMIGSQGWLHANRADEVLPHLNSLSHSPACAWSRSAAPVDVYAGTAELGDQFYRLASPCRSFETAPGMPWVWVSMISPASDDVVIPFAGIHFVVRMFLEAPTVTSSSHFFPSLAWLDYGSLYSGHTLNLTQPLPERPDDAPEWPLDDEGNEYPPTPLSILCGEGSPLANRNLCLWEFHAY